MDRHPLDCFLNPRSVAVIGASTVPHKMGGRRWRSLVEGGFAGSAFPIHPTASEVLGRKAYPSVREVPEPIDLAVVLVRSDLVPAVVRECADLGVPAVLVMTAGFGETGPDGKRAEDELVRIVRGRGGRLVGPNCAGLFSGPARLNLLGRSVPPGPVALIAQSGNVVLSFVQFAREKGLGLSRIVTIGNAADLRVPEYLEFLLSDPETKVIVAYLEGFRPGEGRELFDLLRRQGGAKPLVVLKPGRTEGGRRAALSHTGALTGEDRVVEVAFRQCGVVRVVEAEDAWDAALALAAFPEMRSEAVAVVSDGGGHATIVCDAADRAGLRIPRLADETQRALAGLLPPRCGLANPVDFAGVAEEEPEVIPKVLAACASDPQLGGVILAGHFGGYVKISTPEHGEREVAAAREIAQVIRRARVPVAVQTIYGAEPLPALAPLREAGIPIYRSLEGATKAMAALWRHSCARRRSVAPSLRRSRPDQARVESLLREAPSAGQRVLLEPEARELLRLFGIPVPPFRVSASPDETAAAACDFGEPVALKLVVGGLVHKSEVGGVLLNVNGPEAARAGHRALVGKVPRTPEASPRVLVTSMLTEGVETLMGAFRDIQFGPVVMFGLGGIYAEALDDVALRLAPLDESDAAEMIREIRAHRLFDGVRGRPPVDLASAVDVLIRISELVSDWPEIAELDLNPVFLLPSGAALADARIVLCPDPG